ncbi:hypothetical protein HK405_006316 [Cladochytrium tenue]|nr:hypothetical protein HK405_006316 [Cladochytrium tenue]
MPPHPPSPTPPPPPFYIEDAEDVGPSAVAAGETAASCAGRGRGGWVGALRAVVANAVEIGADVASHWGKKIWRRLQSHQDPQVYYRHLMTVATNYEQWAAAGQALDRLQGKNKWKSEVASPDYDYRLVQDRLAQLRIARESGDLASMIFILRTSLNRNLGDMGNPRLYSHTHVGTKRLIENYIEEVTRQLNLICDTETDDFNAAAKYEFFTNTQKTLGRTALLLSGGAALGVLFDVEVLIETMRLNINDLTFQAIFVQRYYGDITIVPSIGLSDFAQLISNPNAAMMTAYTIAGERATWKEVSFIKNHCQVEMAIDEIIYRLRVKRFKGVQLADQPQSAKGKGALKRKIGGFTAIEQEPSTTTLFSRGTQRMPSM